MDMNTQKIGLLGGSFNPAHLGHVYISLEALQLLGLDEVWWLVSPQNPLKNPTEIAPFALRMQQATVIAAPHPVIKVLDFEETTNTRYTFDTISTLKQHYPQHNFIWLMGADNLLQLPKWHKWQEIMHLIPIAVMNREQLKPACLAGEVATSFATNMIQNPNKLATSRPPAWLFLDIPPHPASASAIRQTTLNKNTTGKI